MRIFPSGWTAMLFVVSGWAEVKPVSTVPSAFKRALPPPFLLPMRVKFPATRTFPSGWSARV